MGDNSYTCQGGISAYVSFDLLGNSKCMAFAMTGCSLISSLFCAGFELFL